MKQKKYGMCYGGAAVKQSGKAKGGGEHAGGHNHPGGGKGKKPMKHKGQ